MSKLLMFLGLAVTLQLSQHRYEVIAQSPPLQVLTRPIKPALVNGFSVQNPLRATFYAFKKGAMKVLVPFEITLITGNGIEPELPAPNQPISGQLRPQQHVNHYPPYNGNTNQKYPQTQQPQYYRPQAYQPYAPQYVQPYAYAPYHTYTNGYFNGNYNGNNANNGNYNVWNQAARPAPYYPARPRQPWPLYRPQQRNTTNNDKPQNYSGNNTAINISSLVNNTANATHPPNSPNASPQNQATETAAPQTLVTTTTTTTTEAPPTTTTADPTTILPIVPEQNQQDVETEIPQTQNFDEEAEASYMQPNYIYIPPGERILLPGMNVNGEYIDQMNGN